MNKIANIFNVTEIGAVVLEICPFKNWSFCKKRGYPPYFKSQYLRNHLEDLNKFGVILRKLPKDSISVKKSPEYASLGAMTF